MSDTLEKLEKHLATRTSYLVPKITCKDGTQISVQASSGHYCSPRVDEGPWSAVEVGYPTKVIERLVPFAENKEAPTATVYGWVPISTVCEVIDECGGMAEGGAK